jgi:hypothetical protein
MDNNKKLQLKITTILPHLNEQAARLYLASEALFLGRGGKQLVAKLAGVSRVRIDKGIVELASHELTKEGASPRRIRKSGGGRKLHKESQVGLMEALEALVSPHTRGDPMKVLLWSSKSLRNITDELKTKGYVIKCNGRRFVEITRLQLASKQENR